MAKKKKMTKAQAAAARHEVTANSIAKKKAAENEAYMKEVRRRAQKQASKPSLFRLIVPVLIVAAIIVGALVFTIGPGALMGG